MYFKLGDVVRIDSATPTALGVIIEDGPSGPRVFNCNTENVIHTDRTNLTAVAPRPKTPTVAILVEEGAVRSVRSDAPITVSVIDLDNLAACAGGLYGPCDQGELRAERIQHHGIRAARRMYDALQIEADLHG